MLVTLLRSILVTIQQRRQSTLRNTIPANGATNAPRAAPVIIEFSEPLDPSSVRMVTAPITITVTNQSTNQAIPGTIEFADDLKSIHFLPNQPMAANTVVQVAILNGSGSNDQFNDLAGNPLAASSFSFTTTAAGLAVTAVSPNSGDLIGGDSVIIEGDRLSPTASVSIDGVLCQNIIFRNQSQLTCTVPPGRSFGAKNVVVSLSNGPSVTLTGGYTYRDRGLGEQAPEIFFEFPPANSSGTALIAANSKMILVFSEPMDTSSSSVAFNDTIRPRDNFSTTTGSLGFTGNNRILVINTNGNFNSNTAVLDVFRFRNATGNSIKDTGGQRLDNILRTDISFFLGGA
ncbi:MAG TPA: hypothetical protein EYO33_31430, partial [Phycisphaerales bacterium]|nr:hypothetical protein [Phycisphaerales bacterium]